MALRTLALLAGAVAPICASWSTYRGSNNRTAFAVVGINSPALSFSTPAATWQQAFNDLNGSPAVIGADGTVYIAGDLTLYAIAANGTLLWQFAAELGPTVPAVAADGSIVVSSSTKGCSYGLSSTGTLLWNACIGVPGSNYTNSVSAAAIRPDNIAVTVYVDSTGSGSVAPLNLNNNGIPAWGFAMGPTERGYANAPAVGADGSIFVSSKTNVTALSPNGKLVWTAPFPNPLSPPALSPYDGTLLIGAAGVLYGVDAATGVPLWNVTVGTATATVSLPAVDAHGVIYVIGNLWLWAIRHDGRVRWGMEIMGQSNLRAPVVTSAGTIYQAEANNLRAINSTDGMMLSSFYAYGQWSEPAVAADGTLIVSEGYPWVLKAYRTNATAPSPSPTPSPRPALPPYGIGLLAGGGVALLGALVVGAFCWRRRRMAATSNGHSYGSVNTNAADGYLAMGA